MKLELNIYYQTIPYSKAPQSPYYVVGIYVTEQLLTKRRKEKVCFLPPNANLSRRETKK
jgi:hypothetical protein